MTEVTEEYLTELANGIGVRAIVSTLKRVIIERANLCQLKRLVKDLKPKSEIDEHDVTYAITSYYETDPNNKARRRKIFEIIKWLLCLVKIQQDKEYYENCIEGCLSFCLSLGLKKLAI